MGPSETLEPPPAQRPARQAQRPDRAGLRAWEIYAVGLPFAVLLGALVWRNKAAAVEAAKVSGWFVGEYIGWPLAPYFAFIAILLVVGVFRLRREPGARRRLTADALLEFVVEVAPSAGFLGTAIGLLECLKNPEDLAGFSVALGTTILGLAMSAAARVVQFFGSSRYRAELNGEGD